MSRNAHEEKAKVDARVRRSRDRLGDALVELIQEKPFESITVQEVLDRAEVGRSTFYTHFKDKDDLFLSDVDEFLESMATKLSRCGESSDRVAPVRELFAHVGGERRFYEALVASGKMEALWDLARGQFSRGIERRLAELPRSRGIEPKRREFLARGFGGAFVSLLHWWLHSGTPETPEAMDELFHRMVWAGVS